MLTVGFLKWYGRDSCFRDEYWRILFCVSSYYYYYYHYYQCQGIKPKALVLPEKLQIPEEACVCFPLILCQYFENFMPCTLIIRVSSPYSSLTLPTASLSPHICVCQRPSNIICVVHMSLDAEPSVDSGIPTQGPTFQENVFTLLKLPTVSRALVGVERHAGICLARACAGLMYAVSTAVNSYMSLSCCAQRTSFPYNHSPLFPLSLSHICPH